jgi:hypothetical protein
MIEKNIRLQPHHARDLLVGRRSDGKRPGYQPPGYSGPSGQETRGDTRGADPSPGGGGNGRSAALAAQAAAAQHAARQRAAAEAAAAQQAAAQRAMQATIAQAERAEVERQESDRVNQLAEARKLMTQPIDVGDPTARTPIPLGKIDPYQQSYISPGRIRTDLRSVYEPGDYDEIIQGPKIDTGPIDVGFQEALRKQQIATDLRQKQQDPDYGQFFRPQPVVEKPSGIMGTAKDKSIQMAKNFAQRKVMEKLGLGFVNPFLGVGSWLLDKFAPEAKAKLKSKFATKRKVSGVDTQKQATEKLVRHEPVDRDGPTIQEAVAGGDVITETAKKFAGITEEDKAEFYKRRNTVQGILDQGSYQGKDLTGEQRNNLLNYIEQISKFLVDPAQFLAYGGRVDKALGGRVRDI